MAANRDRPFVLFYTSTIPHLALQPPKDLLDQYAGAFPETPYPGGKGYLPQRQPRAAYPAMNALIDFLDEGEHRGRSAGPASMST